MTYLTQLKARREAVRQQGGALEDRVFTCWALVHMSLNTDGETDPDAIIAAQCERNGWRLDTMLEHIDMDELRETARQRGQALKDAAQKWKEQAS